MPPYAQKKALPHEEDAAETTQVKAQRETPEFERPHPKPPVEPGESRAGDAAQKKSGPAYDKTREEQAANARKEEKRIEEKRRALGAADSSLQEEGGVEKADSRRQERAGILAELETYAGKAWTRVSGMFGGFAESEKSGMHAIAGNEQANNAKAGSPKEAGARAMAQNPMFLDPKHDQEIKRALDKASMEYSQNTFDQCTPLQKAEILKTVLEAGGKLGLTYDRRMDQKPQTVEEFLEGKRGNCADFSKLLVAVAEEKGLPVQMVLVTFQAQDGTREEEQHLAVFNMGDKIYYLDLSNQILRPYPGFASTEELIKDPVFQHAVLDDYRKAMKDGGSYILAEEPRCIVREGGYEATYWADLGLYHNQKHDWDKGIRYFEKAVSLGLETYWIHAEIGYAEYNKHNYKKAAEHYEKAVGFRETPAAYLYLGISYVLDPKNKDYVNAISAFKKALKIDENYQSAQINLASANLNYGVSLMNSGSHSKAIPLLDEALHYYKLALDKTSGITTEAVIRRDIATAYLDKAKVYASLGQNNKAIETLREAMDYSKKVRIPTIEINKLLERLTNGNP